MFGNMRNMLDKVAFILKQGADSAMGEKQFIEAEIEKWKASKERKEMIEGERYYLGLHKILERQRTAIGEHGQLQTVHNLPNNHVINNMYANMVDQKVNYLVGKPLTIDTQDKAFEDALSKIFDKSFHRLLKNIGTDSLNNGLAWLYVYYDEDGQLRFKRFEPFEILPFWKDAEHTQLEMAARIYRVEIYEGKNKMDAEMVEIYHKSGVERFQLQGGRLLAAQQQHADYIIFNDESGNAQPFNWDRVPLIAFKANDKEIPLIRRVKSLQDGINAMLSDFENNMQEDSRNTILVLVNYDGQNLGEFRRNLSTYGAVKVKTVDGANGDLKSLQIQVNADNYKAIVDVFKKALIENAKGYDAKDDRLTGNPNQMNIQSMYNDIDLDANGTETEYQAAFEELLWFIRVHLRNTERGNFESSEINLIFNRDIMMNEYEIMDTLYKGGVQISQETLLSQVPFINDVPAEMERLKQERDAEVAELDEYKSAFGMPSDNSKSPKGVGDE